MSNKDIKTAKSQQKSKVLETLGLTRYEKSRNWLNFRDLVDERNPPVKSHKPDDEVYEKMIWYWG